MRSLPPLLLHRLLAAWAPRSRDRRPGAACSPSIYLGQEAESEGVGKQAASLCPHHASWPDTEAAHLRPRAREQQACSQFEISSLSPASPLNTTASPTWPPGSPDRMSRADAVWLSGGPAGAQAILPPLWLKGHFPLDGVCIRVTSQVPGLLEHMVPLICSPQHCSAPHTGQGRVGGGKDTAPGELTVTTAALLGRQQATYPPWASTARPRPWPWPYCLLW